MSSLRSVYLCLLVCLAGYTSGCGGTTGETVERLESFEPYSPDFLQQIYELDVTHAVSFLEQNPEAMILDIRGAKAFHEERLPKAFSYDSQFEGVADEFAAIDRDQPVFVYGSSLEEQGIQASICIGHLKDLGFKSIYFLDYEIGIEGWKEAGQPVETGY